MMKLALATGMVAVFMGTAWAVDDPPAVVPAPAKAAPTMVAPEAQYNEGLARAKQQDWKGAEEAYRAALGGRAAFPEAWNGLGYVPPQAGALRRLGSRVPGGPSAPARLPAG